VEDVLSHDQYVQLEISQEENNSEFVFVCKNARKLVFPLNVAGQHKICNLN
jgi:hypothetical protein